RVEDVVAAVLGPRGFVVARVLRLLLAEAHGLDLAVLRAEERHHPLDRVGALLAERDVVFARAALVGVALDRHARVAVLREVAAVRLDQRAELVAHREAVEVEEDDALRQRARRIAQRVAGRTRPRALLRAGDAAGARAGGARAARRGRARGAAVLDR